MIFNMDGWMIFVINFHCFSLFFMCLSLREIVLILFSKNLENDSIL